MHTEETYEGALMGLSEREVLEQHKRSLIAAIWDHGEHCSDADLDDWQKRLDSINERLKYL